MLPHVFAGAREAVYTSLVADTGFVGTPADVRRWAENRRIANAVEVRELTETWGTSERAVSAAMQMLRLFESIHGWPPPFDPIDWEQNLRAWERWARLRRPYVR